MNMGGKMDLNKDCAYEDECAKLAALWNQHEICPECGTKEALVAFKNR